MKKILFILLFVNGAVAFAQNKKLKTDWLFVYYMPYDNNLSNFGDSIINMIKSGVKSKNVIAVVQSDFSDTLGMKRYIITNHTIFKSGITNENSATTQSYKEYLQWVNSKIESKKLSVIFLDHGGKLDELCLDEKPVRAFLKVDSLKDVFKSVFGDTKIDLLFLQVCTKGSIEPIYEFKDVAQYTLCSQTELGAPNYYYPKLFSKMSDSTVINGRDVAKLIVDDEAYNMYSSFTLVDNLQLNNFYKLFADFVLAAKNESIINLSSTPKSISYSGEKYWDMVSFLENFYLDDTPKLSDKRNQLVKFINSQLVLFNRMNPTSDNMREFCGISLNALVNNRDKTVYKNLEFSNLLMQFPVFKIEN